MPTQKVYYLVKKKKMTKQGFRVIYINVEDFALFFNITISVLV